MFVPMGTAFAGSCSKRATISVMNCHVGIDKISMHPEALAHINESFAIVHGSPKVLEIGSRDVGGGTPRNDRAVSWTGIDVSPGDGVDVVGDGSTWGEESTYDVVICAEVFEHASVWKQIVKNAHRVLLSGGVFIGTAAGEGRTPHSAVDGSHLELHNGEYLHSSGACEYYSNITKADLFEALRNAGFADIEIKTWRPGDIYWMCSKS